jgi:hypothetical protein
MQVQFQTLGPPAFEKANPMPGNKLLIFQPTRNDNPPNKCAGLVQSTQNAPECDIAKTASHRFRSHVMAPGPTITPFSPAMEPNAAFSGNGTIDTNE